MTTQDMTSASHTTLPAPRVAVYPALYIATGVVLVVGITLGIVGAIHEWPPQLTTIHIGTAFVLAVLSYRAEVTYKRRARVAALSEIDRLELWLNYRDQTD
ncbi:hypothetical protein NQK81_30605 [Amycolatopsis roodepoortensis]|uniref:hypothetical protein n=1 Tax=Amycolatopsis roodepoortensis TaxID=700274 RepID=UPI00214CF858|nr:hypothetical protein [Amycolatopsis roodepoortensis]UUV29109.1 hypothetical protein NQK81_30605 [Amycolatopsis roodepoortensis]